MADINSPGKQGEGQAHRHPGIPPSQQELGTVLPLSSHLPDCRPTEARSQLSISYIWALMPRQPAQKRQPVCINK